jgi:peptidyl-prolyl cis-trans isomerase C
VPLAAEIRERPDNLLRRVVREPLLHFIVLGVAIFALAHVVEARKQAEEMRIGLDDGLDARLANLYRAQFGVAPTDAQLRILVGDYIDDEVLYRESLRLGLDQDDEIIRRRLIQKLEFLQRDAVASADPTPGDLRAYYDAHPALFSAGARVSFEHVYFNPDHDGDAEALARAREARLKLLAGEVAIRDNAFPREREYVALTREDATRQFGESGIVDALFTARTGEWTEPQRSGFGWHLVRVATEEPAKLLPFDAVLPDVRAAWLHDATAKQRRAQLDDLRARYHVVSREASR